MDLLQGLQECVSNWELLDKSYLERKQFDNFSKMNWNSPMEVHYQNHAVPYDSMGSFVDFFGGLTSDHVNFISTDAPYAQVHYRNILICFSLFVVADNWLKS